MPNQETNQEKSLLLPKVKADCDVQAGDQVGVWQMDARTTFDNVASSLDYKAPGEVKDISAVPTMWARPLSFEMALHNPGFPIRDQVIPQWRGMLAAIALAEVRSLPLKAKRLRLDQVDNPFSKALSQLLPEPNAVLYSADAENPWKDIYIFDWNGQPVGMTSPSTLVVTSEEGQWKGLPWWQDGQLQDPVRFLNDNEKALFWRWLDNLLSEINQHQGKRNAIDKMTGLVEEFRDSLGSAPQENLSLSKNPQFFGVPINIGVLKALNQPVKAKAQPSNVRLIPSPDKENLPDLLIVDPEIAEAWNQPPQNVWIYDDRTLASFQLQGQTLGQLNDRSVRVLQAQDLFLPELAFLEIEDALPGALLPSSSQNLRFNGEAITPLLPLNPILLEYLNPQDLMNKVVSLEGLTVDGEGAKVRVVLDLPLSGMNPDSQKPENYRVYKDYVLKEENIVIDVPVLQVWPNFQLTSWTHYYGFYYDGQLAEDTFRVNFPEATDVYPFEEKLGNYQIVQFKSFPTYVECLSEYNELQGLIVLSPPETVKPTGDWKIGVDFGTSFTNIYVNRQGRVTDPLPLNNLQLQVTNVPDDTRVKTLFEFFVPENFVPEEKPLPLSSVLTNRGFRKDAGEDLDPIFDGRVYVPQSSSFQPQQDFIKTDLKWSAKNLPYNRLFLKHLALHITAMAVQDEGGARRIQWCLSYPSAFSRRDQRRLASVWQSITEDLAQSTGVKHGCPGIQDLTHFRTESLAIAQYFADKEGENLVSSTCIDLGGGTSDISIWERNTLIHQCSVQLAGRDLFSQFISRKPDFILKHFEQDKSQWSELEGPAFNAKLDVLLRNDSANWLRNKRSFVEEEPEFQGLLQLMALGFSGLYYYIGTLLGVLHQEGKYSAPQITPVYIGGNGSQLLNWLAEDGRFDPDSEINALLSKMLCEGSQFKDTEEPTRLSQRPKDEVACGLVLSQSKLKGLERETEDLLIAGEDCEINGRRIQFNERLDLGQENVSQFEVPELAQLALFVNSFQRAIKTLRIEGILPLADYTITDDYEEQLEENGPLWREVQRELTAILITMKGESPDDIRVEPPFILALKALLQVLGKRWVG